MLRTSLCDYSGARILVSGTLEQLLEQEIMMQQDD